MFVFGSGVLIGTPQGGSPINFGLAQEVTLNVATTTKALYGQYNFPVAIGSGTRKMTGKAKMARISGQALGSLYLRHRPERRRHADPVRRGGDRSRLFALHLLRRPITRPSSPIRASSTPRTSLPLKQVASGPTTGQYSVSAGVYTFAAGDAGAAVLISYTYTVAGERREHRGLVAADRPDDHLLGQSVRFRSDDRQAVLGAALQLRRREALVRHQDRGLPAARARLPVLRQRRRPGLPVQLRRRGMSEETFPVIAGGGAMDAAASAVPRHQGDSAGAVRGLSRGRRRRDVERERRARSSEAQLDRLAEATWRAIAHVEPALSLDEFLDLPFSVGDLIQAFPAVARAVGPSQPGRIRASHAPAGRRRRRADGKVDFDALIAHVVANTGWTWDQALDQLTMPRFLALQAEWRRHPPVHWLVAAALKYRPPERRTPSRVSRRSPN